MIKRKLTKLAPFFRSVVVVFLASLFVMSIVYASTTIGANVNTGGTLDVTGETHFTGKVFATSTIYFDNATSTGAINIGGLATLSTVIITGSATTTSLYLSDGLILDGNASTTGDLYLTGGTFDMATSGVTTTLGLFSRDRTTSTSTVSIGNVSDGTTSHANGSTIGCLEMAADDGTWFRCFVTATTSSNNAFVCETGRCK